MRDTVDTDDGVEDHGDDDLAGCRIGGEPFVPHLALVYAAEEHHERLKVETERRNTLSKGGLKPMEVRYLSVWCTEGRIEEWRLVARVEV